MEELVSDLKWRINVRRNAPSRCFDRWKCVAHLGNKVLNCWQLAVSRVRRIFSAGGCEFRHTEAQPPFLDVSNLDTDVPTSRRFNSR